MSEKLTVLGQVPLELLDDRTAMDYFRGRQRECAAQLAERDGKQVPEGEREDIQFWRYTTEADETISQVPCSREEAELSLLPPPWRARFVRRLRQLLRLRVEPEHWYSATVRTVFGVSGEQQ